MPMRVAAMLLLALCALAPVAGAADDSWSRQQALAALGKSDAAARRAAVARLGAVGRMSDVPALIRALRDRDVATRESAESAIWAVWGRSGNDATDALYMLGVEQMNLGLAEDAIATFTRIIEQRPQFAEGWNKRATLYYHIGDYAKSLRDCHQVLKRNPLHFGVLAGYGLIYVELDQPERALGYFRRALRINPNMQGVARNIELLQKLIDERRKRHV